MKTIFANVYYGWWILGGAVLAQFISTSAGPMASGVFLTPLVEDLGLQVWQFATAVSVASAIGGIVVVFVGPSVDRIGPRRIMLLGALFGGLGLTGLSLQSSFWQFFTFQVIASALGWTLFGPLVINATITKWFIARRGWALAIGSAGVSLAGLITPITMTIIVDVFDWRTGYVVMAVAVVGIMVPVALVMRRQPEDLGLLPDGARRLEEPGSADDKARAALISDDRQTYTRGQAIKTASFWLVTVGYGLNAAALGSVLLHAIPYATSLGFPRSLAAGGLGINGLGNLTSKVVWGWGLQRFDARRLAGMAFITSASGVLFLLASGTTSSTLVLMIGFFLYGFGFGGTIPISEFLWARYFGRRHIAAIRSVGRPINIIFATGGPIAAGAWFDLSGSYFWAFLILAGVYVVGAGVINVSNDPPSLNPS